MSQPRCSWARLGGVPLHRCPKNGCVAQVRDSQLACRTHWFQVSRATRNEVYAAWDLGQGALSQEHGEAMQKAIAEMNAAA
jgi:hypothetical protein